MDWAEALHVLGDRPLDEASVDATLGAVLMYREDQQRVRSLGFEQLLGAVGHAG